MRKFDFEGYCLGILSLGLGIFLLTLSLAVLTSIF